MIEKPENVRFAGPDDAIAIYELEWEYSQTSPLIRLLPADPLALMEDIERGLKKYQGGPIEGVHITGLCVEGIAPVGAVNMVVDRWFWTRDNLMLRMRWLYVKRELGAKASLKYLDSLLRFSLFCQASIEADLRKVGEMRPFVLDTSFVVAERSDAMDRLWGKHKGLRKAGSIFLAGLPE